MLKLFRMVVHAVKIVQSDIIRVIATSSARELCMI